MKIFCLKSALLCQTFAVLVLCLLAMVLPARSETGQLLAGTAKINITPKTSEPIHDSVYARSLVLEVGQLNIAFVAVDLVIFTSTRIKKECFEKYGISQVILSSSHNHSGPLVANKIFFTEDSPFQKFYEDQIIKVIGIAANNKFRARISAGKSTFPQLNFNRLIVREDGHARESWFEDEHYKSENPERIPFGPVDAELGVIKVMNDHGDTRAVLMNYAMHADIVCFNYAVSADFPGVATRKVEETLGKDVNCLFIQGASGNMESLLISPRRSGPDDKIKTNYEPMQRTGDLLAWETVKLVKKTAPGPDRTDVKWMTDSLPFTGRYDKSLKFNVQFSNLIINNDISIAVCPGEFFIQFQLDWKEKMKVAGANGFLFGYSWTGGQWPGYIGDIRSMALGGYGADQNPKGIQVGSGESIMSKQLENFYSLIGLMRQHPPK
ncbi:neutral/alkaline non-lysosomal ceramidase N-terminal domain-containing protein [Dyadobacter subterraneus]|uniref:Neutral/alkaline non-lysosomal ceramidase N-terminal domain-containing protein n=1 Tax=Dyadobacter subterraneus TaxID=2773304 RepID=A0ABR9WB70_9BACT|nr:neutral/alkaline non-lysosomal ceramidase N-terminal domain-containing protein [Dyadobacter subterraneus]MBE9462707.1 neutral/alkaline non-lysosomal ceramidase N-terminal domain-containing protein [Dyadobacter subterraneus]